MISEANEEQVRLRRFTVKGKGAAHVWCACGVRVKDCFPMVIVCSYRLLTRVTLTRNQIGMQRYYHELPRRRTTGGGEV